MLMPLDKATLKNKIKEALQLREQQPGRSAEEVAAELADAIDEFVRGGDVVGINTNVTVTVATTGSAAAQTGTGTGTGTQTGTGKIN